LFHDEKLRLNLIGWMTIGKRLLNFSLLQGDPLLLLSDDGTTHLDFLP